MMLDVAALAGAQLSPGKGQCLCALRDGLPPGVGKEVSERQSTIGETTSAPAGADQFTQPEIKFYA